MRALRIAILGDAVEGYAKHTLLTPALQAAAEGVEVGVAIEWVASSRLGSDPGAILEMFDGAVAAPQSPEYCQDVDGLLRALTCVRESGLCCLATCGGAQYALREHACSASGGAPSGLFPEAHCEITGDRGHRVAELRAVHLEPGTRTAGAYGQLVVRESFACSRIPGEAGEALLRRGGVALAGFTPGVGATVFEWPEHPFYVATLFLPQWSPEQPHPLFGALLSAARARAHDMGGL